jgi:hypothetical protein
VIAAALAAPLANGLMVTTAATTVSGTATQMATNFSQISQGWVQVELKKQDMEVQLVSHFTIPPIQHP